MALQKGETANKNGRPPKIATTVIKALKEQGIARVDRTEVDELIARLQNMPRKKLMKFAKDEENTPMVVMLIARGMLGKAGHEFLVRDLWDRAHGRAKQSVDVAATVATPAPVIQIFPPEGTDVEGG